MTSEPNNSLYADSDRLEILFPVAVCHVLFLVHQSGVFKGIKAQSTNVIKSGQRHIFCIDCGLHSICNLTICKLPACTVKSRSITQSRCTMRQSMSEIGGQKNFCCDVFCVFVWKPSWLCHPRKLYHYISALCLTQGVLWAWGIPKRSTRASRK